ncbi:Permease of the drug/metabolite transporter (DMT) superfamily protein [Clostridiaceae bacterium JG1575]|nr:Permease of the drug/metabolite transporter (DMT) superfamily protein [Clostridiaceae bacterium JG1575]
MHSFRYKGEAALLLTAIIWGYGFVAVAQSLLYFTPSQVMFFRFAIALAGLLPFAAPRLRQVRWAALGKGVRIGFFLFSGFVFQTIGLQTTTPSRNAFLTAVNVVLVPLLTWFLFRRKLSAKEAAGAIIALLGLALLTLDGSSGTRLGDGLTLICAVLFAFQIIYTTQTMEHENPLEISLIQIATCMVFSLGFMLWEGAPLAAPSPRALGGLLFLGLFSTALATCLQTYGQKYTSETRSAIFLSTECLWGTVFSVLFWGEILPLRSLLGGLLIFTAIVVSEWGVKKTTAPASPHGAPVAELKEEAASPAKSPSSFETPSTASQKRA